MTGIVLKDMFGRIAERGRALVEKRSLRLAAFAARAAATAPEAERIEDLCRALHLLDHRTLSRAHSTLPNNIQDRTCHTKRHG